MKKLGTSWLYIGITVLVTTSAISADTQINPGAYPSEALKLADTLAPELAAAIKACNVEKARSVHTKANDFIYKTWNWTAQFQQLKPYRACFQMLSDIAATTQLVTNRFLDTRPNMVAGLYDANYAACRKLADPTYQAVGISGTMKWPSRFGPEPGKKPCG